MSGVVREAIDDLFKLGVGNVVGIYMRYLKELSQPQEKFAPKFRRN
jgi:hypothetical protein